LDAVGNAFTESWLDMVLVAATLPIPASWLPWSAALGRRIQVLLDQSTNRHVGWKASPVAVIDPQLGQSQFGVLSVSMHHL
jgi:hypothetical protein